MEQEIFKRKQFTFYESFYSCIKKTLKKKSDKLSAYEALIQYALYGSIENFENLSDCVSGLLEAIYPVLNTARKNSKNALQDKNSEQTPSDAAQTDTGSNTCYKEKEKEIENKKENEIETEKEKERKKQAAFRWFWNEYPKQIGQEDAYKAFCDVTESVQVLVDALRAQRASPQWQKDGGRYIPNPATWLRGKRWLDKPPQANTASPLGELEIQAIKRIMHESSIQPMS